MKSHTFENTQRSSSTFTDYTECKQVVFQTQNRVQHIIKYTKNQIKKY